MRFDFALPVVDRDGLDAGVLDRVLLDADRRCATHLVVRSPVASEDILVSTDAVRQGASGRVELLLGNDDLARLPRYYEGRTGTPAERVASAVGAAPAAWRELTSADALGGAVELVELGPAYGILATDGARGALVGISVRDPNMLLAEMHVSFGGAAARVPEIWIDELGADSARLRVASDALGAAPPASTRRPLEGLSGMGGFDGETRDDRDGPHFVDELREREELVAHSQPTSTPGETGGRRADELRAGGHRDTRSGR